MLDLVSIIIGILITIVIITIFILCFNERCKIRQVTIAPDIANDLVGETPKCPDCQSYDLELRDNYEGVTWLKKSNSSIDGNYFYCKKCGRSFSNENWKDAKVNNINLVTEDN